MNVPSFRSGEQSDGSEVAQEPGLRFPNSQMVLEDYINRDWLQMLPGRKEKTEGLITVTSTILMLAAVAIGTLGGTKQFLISRRWIIFNVSSLDTIGIFFFID